MKFNHDVGAYLEYAEFLPVLLVLEVAVDRSGWSEEQLECYYDSLTEIGSERALAGMRDTAMNDARRIYDYEAKRAALRRFAEVAPLHAEVARGYADCMPV